jgi:hypothetical protein
LWGPEQLDTYGAFYDESVDRRIGKKVHILLKRRPSLAYMDAQEAVTGYQAHTPRFSGELLNIH